MTEEEKKKLRDGFRKSEPEEIDDSYWTDERKIESAKRIIEKLQLKGELQ